MAQGKRKRTLLLFGATGAIGQAISEQFQAEGWLVIKTTRSEKDANSGEWVRIDPFSDKNYEVLADFGPYAAVCWAQGMNINDSVYSVEIDKNAEMYRANCLFIIATLRTLLDHRLLTTPARLCVISSIWQTIARQNKLSYCMTKAALQGLVLSAAADLAVDGHLINAILPGALETPMTRQNLSSGQIDKLASQTLFKRLPALNDVSSLAYFLCSEANTSITGQFIAADLGFSHVRIL